MVNVYVFVSVSSVNESESEEHWKNTKAELEVETGNRFSLKELSRPPSSNLKLKLSLALQLDIINTS
jgi:hypothetical protein